jgi:23S rRNA pseudouridine1911/1915/1917 synthase
VNESLQPGNWTLAEVGYDEGGERLDSFVARRFPQISRSRAQKLIEDQHVRCNGVSTKVSSRVAAGDKVEVFFPAPKALELKAEEIPLHIYYQDQHLAVIEKPAGLVVHPAAGHSEGTLVNALLHHFGDLSTGGGIGGELRPGIVHRIDRNTSGILLVTKTDLAHAGMSKQFKEHTITRRYRGLAWGHLLSGGEWNESIGRDPKDRKRMAAVETGGRTARTRYRRLESFQGPLSAFEAELFTGRTHQIRVHFSHHGFPLIGDSVYTAASRSGQKAKVTGMNLLAKRAPEAQEKIAALLESGRQFLHAAHLGFVHPATNEKMEFNSELPPDLAAVMLSLEACRNS